MMLEGKVALVTGAASGIGRAAADAFASAGASVVVADIDATGCAAAADAIRAGGGRALSVPTDVTSAAAVRALLEACVDEFGTVDAAFNNAGILSFQTVATCTEEDWDRTMGVNAKAIWLCMQAEIAVMAERGGGAIVNTASAAAMATTEGVFAYTVSKHAVLGMTRSAAVDCAGAGIRVNAICPGVTVTPMLTALADLREDAGDFGSANPLGRGAQPHEPAAAAVWLCSSQASFITGTSLVVDGGALATY